VKRGRGWRWRARDKEVDQGKRGLKRYEKMCSVDSGCNGQKFMEREDPWCETANLGKPGHAIGVLTNGSAVKPTCVWVFTIWEKFEVVVRDIEGGQTDEITNATW
jgi:hypothetical protein